MINDAQDAQVHVLGFDKVRIRTGKVIVLMGLTIVGCCKLQIRHVCLGYVAF